MAGYVYVQWYWMIYPPVVLAISLGFLASIVAASYRYRVLPWKNNCLPMIFCQVDGCLLNQATILMRSRDGIEDLQKTRIALTQNENGFWLFESLEADGQTVTRFDRQPLKALDDSDHVS